MVTELDDAGYSIEEGVLSGAECDRLLAGLEENVTRSRAGARHLMSLSAVAKLARDERLLSHARSALGGQAVPFRATLFEKSARSNWLVPWHQDTALPLVSHVDSPEWGPWSTKEGVLYAHAPTWALQRIVALRVHLDACQAESGPLRVVPGSHGYGVLTDEQVLRIAHAQRAFECLVGRGGVLVMRPLVIHASSKAISTRPRRVLHIEYAASLELLGLIRLAVA
jgi:hypothetical protein